MSIQPDIDSASHQYPQRPAWALQSRLIPPRQLYPLGDFDREQITSVLAAVSEVLQEFVSFGCHVITWTLNDASTRTSSGTLTEAEGTYRAVAVAIYRAILDSLDGISVLLAAGCGDQASVLLRNTLESVMRLLYLMEDDSLRRTYAVLTCNLYDKLDFLETMDSSTEAGQVFDRMRRADVLIPYGDLQSLQSLAAEDARVVRAGLEASTPSELAAARAEYGRLARPRRMPAWHSFWDGPASVYKLAEAVKMGAVYGTLYREASRVMHGNAAIDRLDVRTPGVLGISQLRHPGSLSHACNVGGSMALHATRRVIEVFVPQRLRDYAEFYMRVRPSWRAASSSSLIEIRHQ
jgi:hypothetical protein